MVIKKSSTSSHNIYILLITISPFFNFPSFSQSDNQIENATGREIDLLSKQSDEYGYLRIASTIDSFFVIIDNDLTNYSMISTNDSIKLSVGRRNITIANPLMMDRNASIEIVKNEVLKYRLLVGPPFKNKKVLLGFSSYPRLLWQANIMIFTDDDSDIYIDGKWFGRGIARIDTTAGKYKVETINKTAGKSKKTVDAKWNRLSFCEMYNKPQRSKALLLTLLPGFRQIYINDRIRGSLLLAFTSTSIIMSYVKHQEYIIKNNEYHDLLNIYPYINTELEAKTIGDQMQQSYNQACNAANMRDIFLYTSIGLYIVNIIDAIISGPVGGYREEKTIDPFTKWTPFFHNNSIGMQFQFNF